MAAPARVDAATMLGGSTPEQEADRIYRKWINPMGQPRAELLEDLDRRLAMTTAALGNILNRLERLEGEWSAFTSPSPDRSPSSGEGKSRGTSKTSSERSGSR